MMIPGKLTKISDNETSLRSNEVVGFSQSPPTVGLRFYFFAKPVDSKMKTRIVSTSPIIELWLEGDVTYFKTFYSYYRLEAQPIQFTEIS